MNIFFHILAVYVRTGDHRKCSRIIKIASNWPDVQILLLQHIPRLVSAQNFDFYVSYTKQYLTYLIKLCRIQGVGVSTSPQKWFNSYPTNRYQVVRIHSSVFDPLPVECGVPQGSILGPLLFSIFENDLPEVPRHCSTECYVEDTKLFVSFICTTPD